MINFPKDLQKKNFYHAIQKMASIFGWEILETDGLLALKSEARIPLVNFIWGDPTPENIEKIKSFYQNKSFAWLLTAEQDDKHLLNAGFNLPESYPELVLSLDEYKFEKHSQDIEIKIPKSNEELDLWMQVASETLEISAAELREFFEPLIKIAGDTPFLIYYEGMPAATSLVYCDDQSAGVYAMTTLKKFRRNKLGWAATQACLEIAKNKNVPYAVLYSSPMGEPLYKKMGFKTSQILKEYFFNHHYAYHP